MRYASRVLVVGVSMLLVGCNASTASPSGSGPALSPSAEPSSTIVSSPTAQPRGGTLTVGIPQEIVGMDPPIAQGPAFAHNLVYETLVTIDGAKVQPGLATSWDQPSPTEYIFHLRPESMFSNGRPVVAADVVTTFNHLLDPKVGTYWKSQLGDVTSVTAVDDHTVKIDLGAPLTSFVAALANRYTSIIPGKEFLAGTFDPTKEMIGSGPFMVANHVPNESWTLDRNPHYWDPEHPIVDKVVFKIIKDESARIAALRDGTIDVAEFDNGGVAPLMANIANVKATVLDTPNWWSIRINARTDPFTDVRVRQAVVYALDRNQVRDLALAGYGRPTAAVAPQFGDSACDISQIPTMTRNVDKAKALLAEAGNPSPKVEIIAVTTYGPAPGIAQVLQQNLQEAGFQVTIKQMDVGAYLAISSDPTKVAGYQIVALSLPGYADPAMSLAWFNQPANSWTTPFYLDDPTLDKELMSVNTLQDGPDRTAAIQQACQRIADNANMVPLVTGALAVGVRTDRVNAQIPAFEAYGWATRGIPSYSMVNP